MKQDKYSTATPLQRWSNRSNSWKPRWARPKTDHHAPANVTESFMPEPSLSLSPDPRRAIKEVCKVINRDWVNHQASSLSHNIHVVSYSLSNEWLFSFIDQKNHFDQQLF